MLKRKLCTLMATAVIASSSMMPVKQAEAGVLLGGAAGIVLGVSGIAYGAICGDDCGFGSTLNLGVVIGLVILDENEQPLRAFDTIPSYLFQEIQDQASLKSEFLDLNQGFKEVVFTHKEVDELFELADDTTSLEQLDHLRDILTSSSL